MRIWITGGAGFLGQRLVKHFSGGDNHIVSLSRRANPIADESVLMDLAGDRESLFRLVDDGRPDVVIHAASRQPGEYGFTDFVKSNVLTTENLLDSLKQSPPRLIIYTSTQSVYSKSARLPFTEQHPASSAVPYAATKRWGEQLMETFHESEVIVLRLPSLYGAGQGDSFIDGLARLAQRNETIELFSRGELIRDALHISDVVAAVDSCISRPPEGKFFLMNLGCGHPIQTREYAEALVEALESNSRIVASDRPSNQFDCYADIRLAKELIGFRPTDLRESLRTYANELRA